MKFRQLISIFLALCLLSAMPSALAEAADAPEVLSVDVDEDSIEALEDPEIEADMYADAGELTLEDVPLALEEGDVGTLPALSQGGVGANAAVSNASIVVDEMTFPDEIFRNYLLANFDQNQDTLLSEEEIAAAQVIDLSGNSGIQSLMGIQLFTELTWLSCDNTALTDLDVHTCTKLKRLEISENQLASLNIAGCEALESIDCSENQLTILDLTGCVALKKLECDNNQISALNLATCSALTELWCSHNQLVTLDLSACPMLVNLYCDHNQLTALEARSCQALRNCHCYNNSLASLDLSGALTLNTLYCQNNKLTALSVASPELAELFCNNNSLPALNVTSCAALTSLSCEKNSIRQLDVRQCPVIAESVAQQYYRKPLANVVEYERVLYASEEDVQTSLLRCDDFVQIVGGSPVKPVILPTSVTISCKAKIMEVGKSQSLKAVLKPSGATTKLTWKSNNTKVATVNTDGRVKAKATGTATITVTTQNNLSASVKLTVVKYLPTEVTIREGELMTLYVGDKLTLTTNVLPKKAKTTLTWTSSNKKVVKVNKKGVVKAVGKGSATVTVKTDNGLTAAIDITVPAPPTKIAFEKKNYMVSVGKTVTLKVKLTPAKAKTGLKWSTNNKKIATVSKTGVVKGIRKGTAIITVKTSNNKSVKVNVTVK